MQRKVVTIIILLTFFTGIFLTGQGANALSDDPALNEIFGWEEPTLDMVIDKLDQLVSYSTHKFSDIKSSDWYISSLSKLVGLSGIDGYSDGKFRPQNPIKVSEFTKILLAAAGYKQSTDTKVWYSNYVTKAKELGVIDSSDNYVYTDGMKRKDMAKMICKLLNIKPAKSGKTQFTDAGGMDTSWIDAAFNEYLIRGYYSKYTRTFKPDQTATRAEVTEMVIRALEYRQNPEEFKKNMKNYYDKIESAQDEKDGGQAAKTVKGYKIPNDLTVMVRTDLSTAEIVIGLNLGESADTQYKEAENILASKFGSSEVTDIMNYVKQLSGNDSVLPKKDFTIGGQTASVGGQNGSVSIVVYPKD
jgi:hypothetical protein